MNEKVETKGKNIEQGKEHFLDLKLPIGCLLTAYGLLLGIYGLVTKKEIYQKSLGVNVNLLWGVLMLVIGAAFLFAAYFKRGKDKAGAEPQ
jgi:hypothetical protein